ncbi:adenosine receptor A1-like [Babylonia areolata]|uniref:adenosine receptor A1-like n=1 Tax=Babylonia areolata TaxID=304850 RepID=UPI003FD63D56
MGLVTNIIVLLAIYKEHRLRTVSNCFVGSLAASDVLASLLVPPLVIVSNGTLPMNISFYSCVICNSLVILLTSMSVLNVLSLSVERFVAIRIPFIYRQWMGKRRALRIVAATWLVATLTGLPPILGWNKGEDGYSRCTFRTVITLEYLVYFIFFVYTLPPLVAMTMIYIYIFHVVRRTRKRTEIFMTTKKDQFKETLKRSMRSDMGILLVIVVFSLCWMPFHITNTFLLFSDSDVPPEFYQACHVLTRLNPVISPFLFAFGYSHFKITIKKLLFKRCINIEDDTFTTVAESAGAFAGQCFHEIIRKEASLQTQDYLETVNIIDRRTPLQTGRGQADPRSQPHMMTA